MPALILTTNVKLDNVKAFVLELSKLAAKVLDKPEKYISIQYDYNEVLTFAGTFDPAFLFVIYSLDNFNPSANEEYSAIFFNFLKEKLGVPGDRGYIVFNDPGRANIGHQGITVETLFK